MMKDACGWLLWLVRSAAGRGECWPVVCGICISLASQLLGTTIEQHPQLQMGKRDTEHAQHGGGVARCIHTLVLTSR